MLFPLFIPKKLTQAIEGFSADNSMAELFDSAAASSDLFWIIELPRPWELHSSHSDYFREQVLWLMLCAEVWLRHTSLQWYHSRSSFHLLVLIWYNGYSDCVLIEEIHCCAEIHQTSFKFFDKLYLKLIWILNYTFIVLLFPSFTCYTSNRVGSLYLGIG